MPRFERRADNRFWELHLWRDGKTLQSRTGRIGSDGRASSKKTFATKKAAAAEFKSRVQEQLAAGYERLPDYEEPATDELLEAIAADPSQAGMYLVYADWLQDKRHPRGQLIALQAARAERPTDKALLAAEKALLQKYPKLAPEKCGLCAVPSRRKLPPYATSELRWQYGFIESARLCRFLPEQAFTIRELLVELLEHPAARFLRRLELGVRLREDGVVSYADALTELARLAPKSLRSLSVVEAPPDAAELAFSTLGPVDEMLAAMPNLEVLQLGGQEVSFGTRRLGGLKRLRLVTTEPAAVKSLVDGDFPSLEQLELDCGDAPLDLAAARRLFNDARMPTLRHLALVRTARTDELVKLLVQSPLMRRLETLSLANGHLTTTDLLVKHASAFAALKTLDLSNNELSAAPKALLALFPSAVVGAQRRPGAAPVSLDALAKLSRDPGTLAKAKTLATPKVWSELSTDGELYWGLCQGSDVYEVIYEPKVMDTRCNCPRTFHGSDSCKHGVALAMLASSGHRFARGKLPAGFGL